MFNNDDIITCGLNKRAECSQRASANSDDASAIMTPSKTIAAVWKKARNPLCANSARKLWYTRVALPT